MNYRRIGILFLVFFGISFTSMAQEQGSEAVRVVKDHLDAFNNHDVKAMMENISDDFTMYSVLEDTVLVGYSNKAHLEFSMLGYFKNYPNVKSKLINISGSGRFVMFTEKAIWGSQGEYSQSSIGVYEIVDKKIRRAWYYQ